VLQSFISSSPAGETKSGQNFGLATKVKKQDKLTHTRVAQDAAIFVECKTGNLFASHITRPDFTG